MDVWLDVRRQNRHTIQTTTTKKNKTKKALRTGTSFCINDRLVGRQASRQAAAGPKERRKRKKGPICP